MFGDSLGMYCRSINKRQHTYYDRHIKWKYQIAWISNLVCTKKKKTLLTRTLNKKYLRLVFHIENAVKKDICDNT